MMENGISYAIYADHDQEHPIALLRYAYDVAAVIVKSQCLNFTVRLRAVPGEPVVYKWDARTRAEKQADIMQITGDVARSAGELLSRKEER